MRGMRVIHERYDPLRWSGKGVLKDGAYCDGRGEEDGKQCEAGMVWVSWWMHTNPFLPRSRRVGPRKATPMPKDKKTQQ